MFNVIEIFLNGKFYMYMVGLEPMTSSTILVLQWEEIPFELELIGITWLKL